MRCCAASVCAGLVVLCAGDARADDKMDDTFDLSVGLSSGWLRVDGLELEPAPATPAPALLAPTRFSLSGSGPATGMTARSGFTLDGVRFGIGLGVIGVDQLVLEVDGLPPRTTIEPDELWGVPLEAYLGYAFGSPRGPRPYLELRGSITILQAPVDVSHEELGELSQVAYNGAAPGLAANAGVLVPLNEYFFADASIGLDLVGPQLPMAHVAIGVPIPLDNL